MTECEEACRGWGRLNVIGESAFLAVTHLCSAVRSSCHVNIVHLVLEKYKEIVEVVEFRKSAETDGRNIRRHRCLLYTSRCV